MLMVYIIDKTRTSSRIRSGRAADYQELKKEAKTNPDPQARMQAEKAMYDIRHEDKLKTSMRESLIKAHRTNDQKQIKEINHHVMDRKKYQNNE